MTALPDPTANFIYLATGLGVALIGNGTLLFLAVFNRRDNKSLKNSVDTGNGITLAQSVAKLESKIDEHIVADDVQFLALNHILEAHSDLHKKRKVTKRT